MPNTGQKIERAYLFTREVLFTIDILKNIIPSRTIQVCLLARRKMMKKGEDSK